MLFFKNLLLNVQRDIVVGITLKNKRAIAKMRTAGQLLAKIFEEVPQILTEGMSTLELDSYVDRRMKEVGLVPACKGYGGYRHATCVSVNDGVIHGVPSAAIVLRKGDCVKLDVVGAFQGYCADMARTYVLGDENSLALEMRRAAQLSLDEAIKKIRPGIKLGDVCATVQNIVESAGFNVVRAYAGHGIGKNIHEEPEVPNFGKAGSGVVLLAGMTLAIEPMVTQGACDVRVEADKWTVKTRDGGLAVHVEDTVLVTVDGVEVLTRLS